MEKFTDSHSAMRSDTSDMIGKLTEDKLPVLDFLSKYLPYDPESNSRTLNPNEPITPKVAKAILPTFSLYEEQYIASPQATAREIKDYFGLEPSNIRIIVDALSAIASHSIEVQTV